MSNWASMQLRTPTIGLCIGLATLFGCLLGPELNTADAAAKRAEAPLSLVHTKTHPASSRRRKPASRRVRRVRRSARRKIAAPEPAKHPLTPAIATVAAQDSHDGVVTLAAGEAGGTDARAASDIVAALGSKGVRVMPLLAADELGTLRDLPTSSMVDVALARSDVLDQLKIVNPTADRQIGYVARLFDEEICLLAAPGISNIRQLDGKKVGVDVAGSSNSVTGRNVFQRLGLHPQFVETDASTALSQLDKGELDAVVVVDGKPAPVLFAPRANGVHIISIPYDPALQDQYYPSWITHSEYPTLVPGGNIDTIAVATILVAPMDGDDASRNDRITNFAHAFLTDFDALLGPGRHPKWRDVNLAADAPGWSRIPAAKQWLDSAETEEEKHLDAFGAARPTPAPAPAPMQASALDRAKLFQEFMKWNVTRAP